MATLTGALKKVKAGYIIRLKSEEAEGLYIMNLFQPVLVKRLRLG